jgi:hypothetical protein
MYAFADSALRYPDLAMSAELFKTITLPSGSRPARRLVDHDRTHVKDQQCVFQVLSD